MGEPCENCHGLFRLWLIRGSAMIALLAFCLGVIGFNLQGAFMFFTLTAIAASLERHLYRTVTIILLRELQPCWVDNLTGNNLAISWPLTLIAAGNATSISYEPTCFTHCHTVYAFTPGKYNFLLVDHTGKLVQEATVNLIDGCREEVIFKIPANSDN